ncbi:MAG: beta-galactosidase [Mariniphaga sp.]
MKTILAVLSMLCIALWVKGQENNLCLKEIQAINPEITSLGAGQGFDSQVLHVKPGAGEQTVVVWQGENARQWTRARYLVCEFWHSNDYSAVVNLEFYRKHQSSGAIVAQSVDKAGQEEETPRMAAKIGVLPLLKTKVIFPLEHLNGQEIFLDRFPRQLKGTVLGSRLNPEDISKVAIRFAPVMHPHFEPEFELAGIYLTNELPEPFPRPESPVVDELGQWASKDWPGKTTGERDLKNHLKAQLIKAATASFPNNWSKYGGWKEKRFNATGFFRTHHDGNRWWLVDPEGYAFVSVGVDCIRSNASGTVSGQEDLFKTLPPKNDPLYKEAYSKRGEMEMVDFYQANLMRTFGETWRENWETITSGQIREFRLNTIANWSDMDYARKSKIPYVLPLSDFPSTQVKLFRDFPDVYADEYAENAVKYAAQLTQYKDDPYLIGYFLRNEPHWAFGAHDIAFEMFASTQASESKRRFSQWLSMRYRDTAAFNEAWAMNIKNFEELAEYVFEEYPSEKAKEDFWQFSEVLVKRYVDVPCDEVEKVDPDHLNLGMRYAWISSGLLYKAGDRFDVFSINGYGNPGPPNTAEIARISGKPVMIGEFHFGATDRGLPATGIQGALSQEERGKAYRYYLEQGLARPELIGIHYFQWLDQPVFGRFDGENYNIGFMDICNRPYKELTDAAIKSHSVIYEVANGEKAPFDEKIERIPSIHY